MRIATVAGCDPSNPARHSAQDDTGTFRTDLNVARTSSEKELGLFPGGEVSADVVFLVIDEFWIRLLRPALRRGINLMGNALTPVGTVTPTTSKKPSLFSQ